jgi:hypothetical protein
MYWNRVLRFLRIRKDDPADEAPVTANEADSPATLASERQKVESSS